MEWPLITRKSHKRTIDSLIDLMKREKTELQTEIKILKKKAKIKIANLKGQITRLNNKYDKELDELKTGLKRCDLAKIQKAEQKLLLMQEKIRQEAIEFTEFKTDTCRKYEPLFFLVDFKNNSNNKKLKDIADISLKTALPVLYDGYNRIHLELSGQEKPAKKRRK